MAADRQPLTVDVALGDRTKVTVSLADRMGTGESASPLEAMQSAVGELAKKVPVAPMTERERADWGASDDASGRRIERVWRRLFVNQLQTPKAKPRRSSNPIRGRPRSHAILALVALRGSKTSVDAVQGMQARLDRVSGARKKGLSALGKIMENPNTDEAMRDLRQAYADAPDDADIAGLYAAVAANVVASDEGFSLVDRLAERFPTHALLALQNAVSAPPRHDLERDARYLSRRVEVLPELACGDLQFENLLARKKVVDARARMTDCKRFFGSSGGGTDLELIGARIDLAAGAFDAAHDAGVKKLGDPRPQVRADAAAVVIAAFLSSGRLAEAEDTMKSELARQRDQESPLVAMRHAHAILRLHRRLGTKAPAEIVSWLADTSEKSTSLGKGQKLSLEVELALARADAPKQIDDLLGRIDAMGDPTVSLGALPLVRARRGDRAAVDLYRRSARAADGARRLSAIDVALALEATHASPTEIEDAVAPLDSPYGVDVNGFDSAVGEAIEARVLEAAGKHADAQTHAKALEKRFARADSGLAEVVAKLK